MIKNQKGFTFIEMIVVITITSVLISAGVSLVTNIINNNLTSQRFNNLAVQAEQSIILFGKELKSSTQIVSGSATALNFINSSGASVTYQVNGSTFERNENGGSFYTVNNLINSLTFHYYDENLIELTLPITADDVRLITLSINFTQDINNINLIQTTYLMNIS